MAQKMQTYDENPGWKGHPWATKDTQVSQEPHDYLLRSPLRVERNYFFLHSFKLLLSFISEQQR